MTDNDFYVEGSIRGAHADGCSALRFHVPPEHELPGVGEEVHIRDPEGCEAWGNVISVQGQAVTFLPKLATAP